MNILTQLDGVLLIVGYFVVMIGLVHTLKQREKTKESFLVANRNIPGWLAAFSIAATWVWAPSMFVASEKAYTQGLPGVFWFIVPNVLTLVLFGFFANWMRRLRPEGWTFSDYIREKYSDRVHNLYLIESIGLQIFSFAVQLLAGGAILHKLTGLPFFSITAALALIPLAYTFKSGIRASIMTDYWQMLWILAVLLIGLPIMFFNTGADTLVNGLGGITGDFSSLFSNSGLAVALSFGIPTTIGLLSGTFGDQMFWQRIFSIRQGDVKKAMMWAALIFAVVPVSLALFGFFAAGAGLYIADTQLTNVGAVLAFTPKWFLWVFLVMILSGLISTVDSILCAVSSVAGHDVGIRVSKNEKWHKRVQRSMFWFLLLGNEVRTARLMMIAVTFIAIGIANIPGMTILYLFLFYGTLRSSVMLPTIFAIKGVQMSEKGLFYGILLSMCVGLPIFAVGNISGSLPFILAGSFFTILASGLLSILIKEKKPLQAGPVTIHVDASGAIEALKNVAEELKNELLDAVREATVEFKAIYGEAVRYQNNQTKRSKKTARKILQQRRKI